jgi:hypothetical protein
MKTIAIILISSLILALTACKKESFITSPLAAVRITADTLNFDTVFTTAGSVTGAFKIVNENDQKLKISSVKLMGGAASPFKINVDGFVGPEANDLDIEPNDSMYVFVSVLINPNSGNLPFVVQDSIKINYNGVDRWVQLEAWGQNAHFFRNKFIAANETWINDLPYVILGYLYVDSNKTLTIDKGCRIYVHGDAPVINQGTMIVNGQKDSIDRVYFQGDRLDEPYRSFPASWPGIYFSPVSKDNVFNYAVLKNSYQTLALEGPSVNANPKLRLNECIVDNAYDAGIITLNSSVQAKNCLISNCGKNLYLLKGGDYQFTHCTVASYSNSYITHRDPVLLVSNYVKVNNVPVTANLNAIFRNCIFWGDNGLVDDEVVVTKSGTTAFTVNFDANLWKVVNPPQNVTTSQIIANQDPLFDSIDVGNRYYNFHLKATSPAINKGVNAGIIIDLDGKPRPVGLPDLGCYEKQ